MEARSSASRAPLHSCNPGHHPTHPHSHPPAPAQTRTPPTPPASRRTRLETLTLNLTLTPFLTFTLSRPARADAKTREALGTTSVLTPVRRSVRTTTLALALALTLALALHLKLHFYYTYLLPYLYLLGAHRDARAPRRR